MPVDDAARPRRIRERRSTCTNDAWRELAARAGRPDQPAPAEPARHRPVHACATRSPPALGRLSEAVIGTTTGPLGRAQQLWLGVLHAGPRSRARRPDRGRGRRAAQLAPRRGLRARRRTSSSLDDQPAGHPHRAHPPARSTCSPTRRSGCRGWRIEPAVLHFAAYQRSRRTAQGVVAAAVQQRLTTPGAAPRRCRADASAALGEDVPPDASATSPAAPSRCAEIDVLRLCRSQRLRRPDRQTRRP